ncbi:MAG: hypothetical protein K8T20_17490 [Planctomycetes bacterium]|nr:hypothetical protein [Planctomycetota bacterium]
MISNKWRLAALPILALTLTACEPEKKSEGGGGSAAAASGGGGYDWVIKARETQTSDPKASSAELARGGKEAIPFLLWQLTGDDTPDAMRAADAFVAMGSDAVEPLDKVVRSKAAHGRNWAIWALGKIGATAKPAADGIRAAGKEAAFRQVAAEALLKIEK